MDLPLCPGNKCKSTLVYEAVSGKIENIVLIQ